MSVKRNVVLALIQIIFKRYIIFETFENLTIYGLCPNENSRRPGLWTYNGHSDKISIISSTATPGRTKSDPENFG